MDGKDSKIRLRLAEDIIDDQVGGAGWMYLDIALQVDKFAPKTVLVKTKKCDAQGRIVLEPKAREKTGNYLVPKEANATKLLDEVSVQAYPKKASWKQKYSYERSVSGNISIKAVEAVGLTAESSKKNKRCVETTCTDLEHRSVDIEDLRGALSQLTAQTSAEGIRNETSFLVVTDVLVASEVNITESQDSQKDGKVSVNTEVHGVGIEAGGGVSKETAASLERSNVGGVVIAIKLARVHYDEKGNIERDSVLAGGSYDGNYTFGLGNKDRDRHYTVTTLARPTGVKKDKFEINVNLLGRQNSTEVKVPQDVCETGLHQTRKSLPTGLGLLPLKGIQVSKSQKKKNFLSRLKHLFSSDEEEDVKLSKVMVTDLDEDRSYICLCSEEAAVADDRCLWFDCKQWREEVVEHEFQVTVDGVTYAVSEDDPILRVFGDRDCDNGLISWSNAGDAPGGNDVIRPTRTFKEYGINAGAVIELTEMLRGGFGGRNAGRAEHGHSLAKCKLTLTFEACHVTLNVGEYERIDTLPETMLSLWAVFHGGQRVTDVNQRLEDLELHWDNMAPIMSTTTLIETNNGEKTVKEEAPEDPNKLVFKMKDEQHDVAGFIINATVPAGQLEITVQEFDTMKDIMKRLRRVYARMNVVHDGKVITDLTQTYRQLGIGSDAHVQLQDWESDNPPAVPTLKEVEEIEKGIESLIEDLQGVGEGNGDSDSEEENKQPTEKKTGWNAARRILWRHMDLQDGDPDIPPEALKMLIRVVGENTVAGEVLQGILETKLEQE